MDPGEDWAGGQGRRREGGGGVRKLSLRHETEGVLGTVYLDLHR